MSSSPSSRCCSGRSEKSLAYAYVLVLGLGYYFPFQAIAAASDYWDALFPDENILFVATAVFFGSTLSIMVLLSFWTSLNFNFYIYVGFLGQLVCGAMYASLNVISPLSSPSSTSLLRALIYGGACLCGLATGVLDCAMLGLVSQFNMHIQEALEVGIGLSGVLSTVYRIITKGMFPADEGQANVGSSAQIYFVVVCVTILGCVVCYRNLRALPYCKKVLEEEDQPQGEQLERDTQEDGPGGPDHHVVAKSQGEPFEKAVLPSPSPSPCPSPCSSSAPVVKKRVLKIVWLNELYVFLHGTMFAFTFPALVANIEAAGASKGLGEGWYQLLQLTNYCFFHALGAFIPARKWGRCGVTWENIGIWVFLRFGITCWMFFIGFNYIKNDVVAYFSVAFSALITGYCVAFSLISMNEIPSLSSADKRWVGKLSAFALNGGLCMGSVLASLVYLARGEEGRVH